MKTQARPLVENESPPVVRWAWTGGAVALFILYVFARWFITGHATPVDPGPDPISKTQLAFIFWVQVVALIGGAIAIAGFVVLPWRREGQLTTTGMLYICWLTLFFQDPMMSYTSASLFYNSYMVNLGSWTLGAVPGWMSPNGHHIAEPLLLTIVGYTMIGYSLCFPVLAALNWIKSRFPAITRLTLAVLGVVMLIALDTLFECLLLRTGVYAYPAAIRAITLFPGQTYQFPLTEGIFYGGLLIGSTLVLLLYRDDKGQTFVERGIDTLRISKARRQWVKFFALFGYSHISMLVLFTIPMQWVSLHADPFPKGYPSYMVNGMCEYGPKGDQCPGPGVMMPRPEQPF